MKITLQDKTVIALTLLYLIGVCAYMIVHRVWFSPDQFFAFAIIGALVLGRAKMFLLDWTPFLSLYFGYEYLRGLVPSFTNRVHIFPMIHFDQFLFGFIPTIKLQALLYNPSKLQWYDYVAVTMYICHFVSPMIVGFLFWLTDRKYFKDYALTLLILSYASFITYAAFPAMPPWMASSKGFLPPIEEVTGVVMAHFLPTKYSLPSIYHFMGGNPVAAMPSLHAAFPTVIFLFAMKKSKIAGFIAAIYMLGVWFAVLYLGEHYFIDILVGVIYALSAYLLVQNIQPLASLVKRSGIIKAWR